MSHRKTIPEDCKDILSFVSTAGIFSVIRDGSGFVLEEQCDNWFEVSLTKDQLKSLANELMILADS